MEHEAPQGEREAISQQARRGLKGKMKAGRWGGRASYFMPAHMSREEVLIAFRAALSGLGWSFMETSSGYAATTPISFKSTGERIEIEVGPNEISVNSSGGYPIWGSPFGGIHKASIEKLMNAFYSKTTLSNTFDHNRFVEKIGKSFDLFKAGVLSQAEFEQAKISCSINLSRNSLEIDDVLFLTMLSPLINSGALTQTEFELIKSRIIQ